MPACPPPHGLGHGQARLILRLEIAARSAGTDRLSPEVFCCDPDVRRSSDVWPSVGQCSEVLPYCLVPSVVAGRAVRSWRRDEAYERCRPRRRSCAQPCDSQCLPRSRKPSPSARTGRSPARPQTGQARVVTEIYGQKGLAAVDRNSEVDTARAETARLECPPSTYVFPRLEVVARLADAAVRS